MRGRTTPDTLVVVTIQQTSSGSITNGSIANGAAAFAKTVKAKDPDIIGLQEVEGRRSRSRSEDDPVFQGRLTPEAMRAPREAMKYSPM